jgi:lactate dehydrogenase-like 2-hydroxyacid dehydrogenase
MPPIVLVTEPEYRRGEAVFSARTDFACIAARPEEAVLAAAVRETGARQVVVGSVPYRGELYQALRPGGVLARYGVGYDSLDLHTATEAGVLCTNTPGVLHQSVAELTLTMIGLAARRLAAVAFDARQGRWAPRQGSELLGKTLAIVGCGEIGRTVARIASAGFGMRVVGYARRPPAADSPGAAFFADVTSDFAAAVRDADFVSLHIPGGPENAHFIDAARLRQCSADAWLINTARGSVVDETALYDAIAARRLAGAVLDVFEREPYQPMDPARDLRTLDTVVLLPHVGSNTAEANRRMAERALGNLQLAAEGRFASMDLLNREVLGRTAR